MSTNTEPMLPGQELIDIATPYAKEKGYVPWTPREGDKGTRMLNDVLDVLETYADHLPVGPRTIGYKLLPKWVPSEYADKDKLNAALRNLLTKARRAELIAWDDIDDDRTELREPWTVDDLPGLVSQLQRDRQADQPYRVEAWVETQGNLGRVSSICAPYGVTVASGSGSTPIKALRDAAFRVVSSAPTPTLLLILVDFDPAGVKNIAKALIGDVRAFVEHEGWDPDELLIVRHLGVTLDQALAVPVAKREPLTAKLREQTPDWPVDFKVELEALEPPELDQLLTDALDTVFDPDVLAAAVAAEPEARVRALRSVLEVVS